MRKLWILGMTMLSTGISVLTIDIVNTGNINAFHGALSCLLISFGLVIVRDEKRRKVEAQKQNHT